MTIYDYNIVMIPVNIAILKAKLSFYLGKVKRGEEILVMDRKTPVARVVPSSESPDDLVIIEASLSPAAMKNFRGKPLRHKIDSTRILREDRNRR